MDIWLDSPVLEPKDFYEIGDNIRYLRKQKGWTQEDLAGRIGSDHRVISRHENGSGINLEMLVRYSAVFSCDVSELLPHKCRHSMLNDLTPESLLTLRKLSNLPASKQRVINKAITPIIEEIT